jgi:tol-pal system protein YbgF
MKHRTLPTTLVAFALLALAGGAAQAQLFGQQRNDESELVARMGRLENQIRQLTGMVEELQHRNSQLEQQLKRVQQDTDFRFQEMNPSGRPPAPRGQSGAISQPPASLPPMASRPQPQQPSSGPVMIDQNPQAPTGRRGDVFDPSAQPDAPGAPRPLGTMGTASPPIDQGGGTDPRRGSGAPLDLGSLSGQQPPLPPGSGLPPAGGAQTAQPPVGQQAVLAPSGSARDEFDLAYGAILRRDYDLAVDGFRVFLANHGGNRQPEAQRLLPDAHFWLGEAQFQLKQYNDSAETFLKISTDYPNAVKAPDALLRLGQSLIELGERETACASLGHVLTKYPKAPLNVKRAVEQEQKRARC